MYDLPNNAILFADSARGVYIPQHFAESVDRSKLSGVSDADFDVLLSGPDAESYWDVWNDVEQSAVLTDDNGATFTLYQDGDLWLVPSDWNPEQFDDAVEALNELAESRVDYETKHKDSGDNYAHMIAESWCSEKESNNA